MSYTYDKDGVRWKNGPVRATPAEAFDDAIADLNAEADAAGYTGAQRHIIFHHRKRALEDQKKVKEKNKGKKKEYKDMTGSERYAVDNLKK